MPGKPNPPIGVPLVRVVRLSDFEAASAMFASWQGRFEQISSGRFESTLSIARGKFIRVIGIEANQKVLLQGHDTAGLISIYPVTDGNALDLWQGHRLTPGQLVFNGPQTEVDHCTGRRTDDLGMSVTPEILVDSARSLLATDASLPKAWATLTPSTDAFTDFRRKLTSLLVRSLPAPSLLESPEGSQLEQECIRSLVAAMFASEGSQDTPSLPARSRILRRAEELMRSRIREPLGAIDLCRELAVSDRTLRLAFRERYGLGPMAYYRALRLNAVRRILKASPGVAVASTASDFGFHHQGNFAADYRRLFGELPSLTRQQE